MTTKKRPPRGGGRTKARPAAAVEAPVPGEGWCPCPPDVLPGGPRAALPLRPGFPGVPGPAFAFPSPAHAIAERRTFWDNGSTIRIAFFERNAPQRLTDQVQNIAPEWTKHANLKFEFVDFAAV